MKKLLILVALIATNAFGSEIKKNFPTCKTEYDMRQYMRDPDFAMHLRMLDKCQITQHAVPGVRIVQVLRVDGLVQFTFNGRSFWTVVSAVNR